MAIPRLADRLERRSDNYAPLRHFAALMVIYGHSYALSRPASGDVDLFARVMPGFYGGNLAVHLFFAISGYLVTLSLLRNPGLFRYVGNGIRRIYPGYIACLLVCAFVIGPMFTELALGAYLENPATWRYMSSNLLPVSLSWELPGVFGANPYPCTINGTLGSLGLEVRWYFYLGLLAAVTIVRRRWAFTTIAVCLIGFGAWEWWTGKPDVNDYRALSQTFLIAALCAHWRDHVRVSHAAMAGLALLAALAHDSRWFGPAVVLAAIYFTFWVAYRLPMMPWWNDRDYSYGLFLYGFPIQQSLLTLQPGLSPLALFGASVVLAGVAAALSWHVVERPFLHPGSKVPSLRPLPA